ncbi:MAG: DUF308 domain-containing protein [Roseobacter sp.]
MKLWIKWLLAGVVSLVCGVFVLVNPVAASFAVTVVAGLTFLLIGGIQVLAGVGAENGSSKFMGIGLGVVMSFLGLSLMFEPLSGIVSLVTLATILIAITGGLRLMTAFRMKETSLFWPMLLSGAFSVLLAAYITANFFQVAPSVLGILLGIELLFNGAGLVVFALFIKMVNGLKTDLDGARHS